MTTTTTMIDDAGRHMVPNIDRSTIESLAKVNNQPINRQSINGFTLSSAAFNHSTRLSASNDRSP